MDDTAQDILDMAADANVPDAKKKTYVKNLLERLETDARKTGAEQADTGGLIGMFSAQSPAAKDPLQTMMEVFAADDKYDRREKQVLLYLSTERFRNRRRMAYVSLYTLLGALIYVGIGFGLEAHSANSAVTTCVSTFASLGEALKDASVASQIASLTEATCTQDKGAFSKIMKENWELISWFGTFFTAVVALYFGAASFRPTS